MSWFNDLDIACSISIVRICFSTHISSLTGTTLIFSTYPILDDVLLCAHLLFVLLEPCLLGPVTIEKEPHDFHPILSIMLKIKAFTVFHRFGRRQLERYITMYILG
jgi:hypothetical protein